jgi:hypothetical protein
MIDPARHHGLDICSRRRRRVGHRRRPR